MEVRRLPVWKTCILTIRDAVDIVLKVPILCLVVFLAAMLVEGILEVPLSNKQESRRELSDVVFGLMKNTIDDLIVAPISVWACRFVIVNRRLSIDEIFGMKDFIYLYAAVSIVFSFMWALVFDFPIMAFRIYEDNLLISMSVLILINLGVVLSAYWISRWILIYPAIAVGHPGTSLRWSARTTKGMVWRIFLIYAVIWIITGAMPLLILSNVYRSDLGGWFLVLPALASTILVVVCAAVDSRIYIWCRDHVDPVDEFASFNR